LCQGKRPTYNFEDTVCCSLPCIYLHIHFFILDHWKTFNTHRSLVYHQGSLLAGNATRAIKCTDVTDWHIGNNSLVWLRARAPGCYQILICALKSDDGVSTKPFDIVELDAKDLDDRQVSIEYVQIAPDGELLVHLSSLERCPGGVVEKLVKMTRGKAFTWQIKLKAMINRPVIGKSAIYFVRPRQELQPAPIEAAFCKASLKDGSIIYEIPLPEEYGIKIGVPYRNTSLTLTPDESWAVWNDLEGKAYIFSTVSGQVIHTFPRSSNTSVVVVSSVGNIIRDIHNGWGYSRSHSTVIFFSKEADAFATERLDLPMKPISESWCFDGDRPVFCYLLHEDTMQPVDIPWPPNHIDHTALDPFTTIGIRPGEVSLPTYRNGALHKEAESYRPDGMQSVVTVTLPPRSMGEDKRRDLEVELPWSFHVGDYFGMYEDYLVFHSRLDDSLTLVDFWPTW